jgi:hypothetical protein
MPSRTPYTDNLHNQGVLITRHPLPEGDAHPFDKPFDRPFDTPFNTGNYGFGRTVSDDEIDDLENEVTERENDREVLMPVEDIDNVLYLNEDDVADGDESQEWQVTQTERGINA